MHFFHTNFFFEKISILKKGNKIEVLSDFNMSTAYLWLIYSDPQFNLMALLHFIWSAN